MGIIQISLSAMTPMYDFSSLSLLSRRICLCLWQDTPIQTQSFETVSKTKLITANIISHLNLRKEAKKVNQSTKTVEARQGMLAFLQAKLLWYCCRAFIVWWWSASFSCFSCDWQKWKLKTIQEKREIKTKLISPYGSVITSYFSCLTLCSSLFYIQFTFHIIHWRIFKTKMHVLMRVKYVEKFAQSRGKKSSWVNYQGQLYPTRGSMIKKWKSNQRKGGVAGERCKEWKPKWKKKKKPKYQRKHSWVWYKMTGKVWSRQITVWKLKLQKSTEATTSISNQKGIRLFFQYCLYAHWKSAHNRSIVSVITDSIPVTALQLNGKLVLRTEMTTERTKSVGQPTKWGFRKQLTPQTLKLENSCLQNMNKYSIESS